jgi:hypothetical protein
VSTPARYAEATLSVSEAVTPSMALVPVARDDGGPRLATAGATRPTNAHRLFYGLGYAGLVLIWTGTWLSGFVGFVGWEIVGVMFVGLGGFGVLIHTLYKPNERKVRHLLLALASLALTVAAIPLVTRISREMYATAAVNRLQPLADELAKDTRIREIGVSTGGNVRFNGFYGPEYRTGSMEGQKGEFLLADVLAHDRISWEEYQAYQRRLEQVGMARALRTGSTIAFLPDGPDEPWLLYVVPSHALPHARSLLHEGSTYYSQPLGGPWYMVLNNSR